MKVDNGIAFPDEDVFMVGQVQTGGTYQIANLEAGLRHVTDWTLAVDCGAHVGLWSRVMSGRFARVIAVEPSPDTFECLTWNLNHSGCANVHVKNVAVGAEPGFVHMDLTADQAARANTGARFAVAGGSIPVQTIDSWNLPSLGFLKLDIEGSEFVALQGATETLNRCRPVVLFENKRLWTRHFGLPKNAVDRLLRSAGYRLAESVSCDQIWVAV